MGGPVHITAYVILKLARLGKEDPKLKVSYEMLRHGCVYAAAVGRNLGMLGHYVSFRLCYPAMLMQLDEWLRARVFDNRSFSIADTDYVFNDNALEALEPLVVRAFSDETVTVMDTMLEAWVYLPNDEIRKQLATITRDGEIARLRRVAKLDQEPESPSALSA